VEKPVLWSDLMPSVGGDLFRSWLESSVGGIFFQYQISKDQGITWTPAASISTIGEIIALPTLTRDLAGQIYLVQAVHDATQGTLLRNWLWDGTEWKLEEDLQLSDQESFDLDAVAAAVSPQGRWGVTYTSAIIDLLTDIPAYLLEFSDRGVEIPSAIPTQQLKPTEQPNETATPEINSLLTPTPTVVVPTLPPSEQGPGTDGNLWTGLVLGAILAGLITVGAIILGVVRNRRT
jgi:hypothetical protein